MTATASAPLRIGNCSGFYGDRLGAMREMLEGGELDVLTGDYLAELTLLILARDQLKDPALGYARTFLRQAEDCLALALDRGVRVVANAGGLNPAALAEQLGKVAAEQGLAARIAYVDGDDLRDRAAALGAPDALTAHAYLGGFGIAEALRSGADVVVTGRVSDASLVVGPAVAHFGWSRTAYDELAGAVVAGHLLECGCHVTGGNFSGFAALAAQGRLAAPLGFPLAEVAADGSCVVTKHPGSGGAVTADTVSAQLFYEIQGPAYLGPDVTAHLDTVRLAEDGPDRVRISGTRGSPPPDTLKVCVNELGGWRNTLEFLLTGRENEAKEGWLRSQLEAAWDAAGARPRTLAWSRSAPGTPGADTQEGATTRVRVTCLDDDPRVAGKGFTAPAVELALASYPGFTLTAPPAPPTPYGVYRPAYVDRASVTEQVHLPDGSVVPVELGTGTGPAAPDGVPDRGTTPAAVEESGAVTSPPVAAPLGAFVHARSGDKGGDANLGLWVAHDDDPRRDERVAWLLAWATPEAVRALVPEAEDLHVVVHPLANLGGVNVILGGLLGDGVAASTRPDPQAKALGEWVLSRTVEIPEALL